MNLDLLFAAAFVNRQKLLAQKQAPDPRPLINAAEQLQAQETYDNADDLLKYAPDLACMVPYWDKSDAIVAGYEAVKLAGDLYLPRFSDETDDEFANRLKLTKFTNIFADIIEGLASKPFEEEITVTSSGGKTEPPLEIKEFIEDVDGNGNNITVFSAQTFYSGIQSVIDWIFIDYPTVDPEQVRTRADEKAANIKPFWSHVIGRNVREVRSKLVNSEFQLSYIRIFEPNSNGPDHVRIFERRDDGVIVWLLYVEKKNETTGKMQFVLEDGGELTIDVIPLVPFITGRRDGASWKFYPPMQAAADLQIQLYQDESGLKFAKTMTGYAMLAANGMRPEMEADNKTPKKVKVGPARVLWGVPDNNGNHGEWKWVTQDSGTLKFLADDIKETKQDLRELGRQPLTATSGNLTVITTAVAAGKARSAVSAWGFNLKDALENALVITAKWMKLTGYDPEVNVYNEYDDFTDGNADVQALTTSRAAGDISQETLWNEYKRRKILAPEFDGDQERERLLNEIPTEPELDKNDDQ